VDGGKFRIPTCVLWEMRMLEGFTVKLVLGTVWESCLGILAGPTQIVGGQRVGSELYLPTQMVSWGILFQIGVF